jgi:hypothetical protein
MELPLPLTHQSWMPNSFHGLSETSLLVHTPYAVFPVCRLCQGRCGGAIHPDTPKAMPILIAKKAEELRPAIAAAAIDSNCTSTYLRSTPYNVQNSITKKRVYRVFGVGNTPCLQVPFTTSLCLGNLLQANTEYGVLAERCSELP